MGAPNVQNQRVVNIYSFHGLAMPTDEKLSEAESVTSEQKNDSPVARPTVLEKFGAATNDFLGLNKAVRIASARYPVTDKPQADVRVNGKEVSGDKLLNEVIKRGATRSLFIINNSKELEFLNSRRTDVSFVDGNFAAAVFAAAENKESDVPKSSWEICNDVSGSIEQIEKEYLDVFQSAAEKYAAFYKEFSKIMGEMSNHISADGDTTTLWLYTSEIGFMDKLDKLVAEYSVNPPNENTTLFSGTEEECRAWAKEFGLDPDACVVNVNGKSVVTIDTRALQRIKESLDPYANVGGSGSKGMACNAAQWQAWMAGVDMHKEDIQNSMQVLAQKYTSANTTFDNLIKVLSSTISSLSEVDKAFINNMR